MIDEFIDDKKNGLLKNTNEEMALEEFMRLESKHTRIRHDEDLREIIRVH